MMGFSPDRSLPPAVVLGLGSITGLQTARILAGHRVPVIGVAKERNHFASTRVCDRVIYSDTTTDEFVGALETLGPTLATKAVLVPCTDLTVLMVSRNRERLASWYHVDSRTAIARNRLSARPHLQAAHWKISSVVPVTAPSTRRNSHESHLGAKPPVSDRGRAVNASRTAIGSGTRPFASALRGRGSHEDRWISPSHVVPEGRRRQVDSALVPK